MKRCTLAATATIATLIAGIAAANAADIRWGTSRVGSSGHRVVTNLAQMLEKKMDGWNISVQPTPGAIVTVKKYAMGDFEGYYGSDVAFHEYATNTNRFVGFKEQAKRDPVQSFWTFTVEVGIGIPASEQAKIKSWSDLTGKRVFTGPRPWDTRAQIERALAAAGVKHDYVEIDIGTAGSQLEAGRIDALGIYSNAEVTTAGWISEASLQTDWAVLNPSEEEQAKMKEAGLSFVDVDPTVFGKEAHVDTAHLMPFFYGVHPGVDLSADQVYKFLVVVEENADELASIDGAFKQIADDMPGMQVRGVESTNGDVKIHPGLARYMKERGVWNADWDGWVLN